MKQTFKHDITAAGIEVRTGEDGTWITLTNLDGSSMSFQPLTKLPNCRPSIVYSIVEKWCGERAQEAAAAGL